MGRLVDEFRRRNDAHTANLVPDPSRMNVDDRRGEMTQGGQFSAQPPSGSTMSPENIMGRGRQEIAVEMPGPTGRESVDRITWIDSREPLRSFAPAEEPARNDSHAGALSEKTQEQIIVFWPMTIPITQFE